ncbi:hypothetical protein GUITHDRAFT_110239 [Guillardia theta CCMP2712]|uniref:Uncharacterized protein n=1 Tax=Guillardia theta (strain CCMP2712) TaxID=905079 RepID=L1J6S6_GUITC|nr:hypothetical protein GUITHDRAFT_110239 [Guillardia theta CCMP2712]EKX43784.1 hypothetical protein GUITHDRAFT_110239 [Guillardia theta CCMP2712]|eukprot:XP_005830764.1 hypothetical protein GUITHDRAFT_110239 [Guillardia theta CCMP2712]
MEGAGGGSGRPSMSRAVFVAGSSFMALVVVVFLVGHGDQTRVGLAGQLGEWSEGLMKEAHGIVEDGGREGEKTLKGFRDGLGSGILEDEEARRIVGGAGGAVGTWWNIGRNGGGQHSEAASSDSSKYASEANKIITDASNSYQMKLKTAETLSKKFADKSSSQSLSSGSAPSGTGHYTPYHIDENAWKDLNESTDADAPGAVARLKDEFKHSIFGRGSSKKSSTPSIPSPLDIINAALASNSGSSGQAGVGGQSAGATGGGAGLGGSGGAGGSSGSGSGGQGAAGGAASEEKKQGGASADPNAWWNDCFLLPELCPHYPMSSAPDWYIAKMKAKEAGGGGNSSNPVGLSPPRDHDKNVSNIVAISDDVDNGASGKGEKIFIDTSADDFFVGPRNH